MKKVNSPSHVNVTNTDASNELIPSITTSIAAWHHNRNLVDGTTDAKQFEKLFEEFLELYLALKPGRTPLVAVDDIQRMAQRLLDNGRLKTAQHRTNDMQDGIGDIVVVLINLLERNQWTLEECMLKAYDDIKDRKGKLINGTFVKESDLSNKQKGNDNV